VAQNGLLHFQQNPTAALKNYPNLHFKHIAVGLAGLTDDERQQILDAHNTESAKNIRALVLFNGRANWKDMLRSGHKQSLVERSQVTDQTDRIIPSNLGKGSVKICIFPGAA
jgi:hypothetical protein